MRVKRSGGEGLQLLPQPGRIALRHAKQNLQRSGFDHELHAAMIADSEFPVKLLFASGEPFLRALPAADFVREAAHVLAELNAIHPFREGNGRTQLSYLTLLADQAGHPLALERLDPAAMLAAMVVSFAGDEKPLATLIAGMIEA
ncbi:hypothetical protein E6C67_08825 [Azospirillum sp. TSA2s]|nr:hypothetical protein E6C67_08825 [Azospirillum sp. TSA2s]